MSEPGEGPRVTKVDIRNNKPVRASTAPPAIRESILSHSEQLKRRALELFPDHDGGEEVARIDAFFEREGLKTKPAKILTPEEFLIYRDELAKIGFHDTILDGLGDPKSNGVTNKAVYLSQLGLIVAVRWPEYQTGQGSLQFQAHIAHEKAHSTSEYEDITYTETEQGISYGPQRVGQSLSKTGQGIFLEEGFAEYMAARYVRNELHLPYGAWETPDYRSLDNENPVPPVYVWPDVRQEGETIMAIGAFPAYGLELLAQRDPTIHSALIEARKSIKGLTQVGQIIERIKTGLYTELQKLGEHPGDFIKGLRVIQTAIA